MKKVFVKTKNVKQMVSMLNRLRDREEGIPGMGLIYGEPGLGKTYAITWWATQNDAILIRSANLMSARWLLEEMVEELGEIPYNKFSDIFNQVVAQLIKTPKTIIVDETDYLTIDSRAVETLRDIHDKTNVPIVLVGMGTANKRLQRHKHLYDRLLEIIKFEPFCKQDIAAIIDQLSEVRFTDCAKKFIYTRTNRFRQIVKTISKAEPTSIADFYKQLFEKSTNSIEHLRPKSDGGKNRIYNFLSVCRDCNSERKNIPFLKFITLRPEVKENIKKQLNLLVSRIPKLISDRKLDKEYFDYPLRVAHTLRKLTDGKLDIDI